jgi:hypothetical protein
MSEVWNHFYMAPNGLSVNCNHCGKFMKRSDSSTKSMWGHLKAFHADLVGEETFRLKRTRRMRGSAGTGTKKSQEKKKAADRKKAQQKTVVPEEQRQQQESASSGSSSAGDEFGDEFSSGVSSRGPSPTEQQQPKSGTQSPKLGGEEPEKSTAAAAALTIQSLLQLGVAELAKEEEKQEVAEKEPIKETEVRSNSLFAINILPLISASLSLYPIIVLSYSILANQRKNPGEQTSEARKPTASSTPSPFSDANPALREEKAPAAAARPAEEWRQPNPAVDR